MKIDGGEMIVRMLKKEGVKYIFSLSGGHINPIYNACINHEIKIIDTRHEQGAALMADAYGRLTREPGVVVLTAGPGHTNALSGFKTADMAKSPVVSISGMSELSRLEMGALQEMDQVGAANPVSKKSWVVSEEQRIPEYIAMSMRYALSHPFGAVNVSVPVDLMMKKVEEAEIHFPEKYRTDAVPYGDPKQIKKATEALKNAKKPVVIVGDSAWYSKAENDVTQFAKASLIPIFTLGMSRGIISDKHEQCFGEANANLNGAAKLLTEADVVMLMDVELNNRLRYGKLFGKEATIISVNEDPTAIGHNRGVDIGIVGNTKAVLEQLSHDFLNSGPINVENWCSQLRTKQKSQIEEWESKMDEENKAIHPLRLCKELSKFLNEDDILTLDGGDIKYWAKAIIPAVKPGHFTETGPFGGIGNGVPHSIAAKLAHPNKRVININGDGSFGFNAMEFDTAVRHNIPFVSVIANDQGWGMILHNQRELYGSDRIVGSKLGPTRYDKFAESLGGYGELVEDISDFVPALERAIASGKPAVLNVMTQSIVSPVTESSLLWKVEMDPTLEIKTGDKR